MFMLWNENINTTQKLRINKKYEHAKGLHRTPAYYFYEMKNRIEFDEKDWINTVKADLKTRGLNLSEEAFSVIDDDLAISYHNGDVIAQTVKSSIENKSRLDVFLEWCNDNKHRYTIRLLESWEISGGTLKYGILIRPIF